MMQDDLTAEDEQDCTRLLDWLEAKLLLTLTEHTPMQEGPRFANMLRISALLRRASTEILEAVQDTPQDRDRYIALVQEVARRIAPGSVGRVH